MASEDVAEKPHAIFIPFPAQSHIKCLLKLAKLLHYKGFYITFVNIEFNHRRLLESRGPNSLDGLPDFRFETIPDGLPTSGANVSEYFYELIVKDFLAPFKNLLAKLNDMASSNVPPVTCVVSDGFMPFTVTAAEELGIPIAIFFTLSACSFMGFKQLRALAEKGFLPVKDASSLDRVVDCIPGMKDIRLRDLPTAVHVKDLDDNGFIFCAEATERALRASAIILHTFDALEQEVLDAILSMFRRVYPIGPLQLLLNQIEETHLNSIGCNLWKEETECLKWLDSRNPNSVVYVNFGSIAVMTKQQLTEFGMGLAKSNHPFLWIIRPDIVVGDAAILPPSFEDEIKDRGFIANWCPQEEVLNHPSIGGFLTHSGWGSTIESISSGVPMLCWPFFADQQTNCWYACNEWGIGMEIDNDVKRDHVDEVVRDLMEGDKGKQMKSKVTEWKKLAEKATGPHGSSSINLENLVNEVLLS